MEELKNCIGGGFWRILEDLYEFFKFNLFSYSILKIKNILIISINLSLFKKILFQKMWKNSQFPIYFSPPKVFPSPPLQTPKQSLIKISRNLWRWSLYLYFVHALNTRPCWGHKILFPSFSIRLWLCPYF